jgi:hypothetical protein
MAEEGLVGANGSHGCFTEGMKKGVRFRAPFCI